MKVNVVSQESPKLLDRMRVEIRVRHYSIRTEQVYVDWVRRFIIFHNKRHPKEMGAGELRDFLSHLAVDRNVSASTQNQAKSALLFLYREVLKIELPWLDEVIAAKVSRTTGAGLNTVGFTVRGEPVEPPATCIEPFDKLRANGHFA